ncbi:Zn-ribbon domain-containing OB-fold protein [Bordetella petrii]|uniref:Zn-ribbon domain-containing OB-fold protein n=1 Tax=Bordetella petrii TaxID=94624 RepID=UPI001E41E644|nr:OB-fold domain-containing protein [Bordetella petrii]MCD0503807.1 OB-fold domain-containing protein [Bordetella petrii]
MADHTDVQRSIAAVLRQPESAPFQQAAADGSFVIPRCRHCGQAHWYPRALCPFCFSADVRWEPASGRGTVYTYTIMRRAKPAYAVGYVQLEEGPAVMTNLVECPFDTLHIGMPVAVRFEPAANGVLVPLFGPAASG